MCNVQYFLSSSSHDHMHMSLLLKLSAEQCMPVLLWQLLIFQRSKQLAVQPKPSNIVLVAVEQCPCTSASSVHPF